MAVIPESASSGPILEVQNNQVTKFQVNYDGSYTAQGTIKDTASVSRVVFQPTAKTIVDGAATAIFSVPIASGAAIGGTLHFSVFATDGTDHQTISGIATYSSVNKAGTLSSTITYVAANEAKAVSSGTLTLAFTAAEDVADNVTYKVQPTGSLTETTYTIIYTIFPLRGEAALA
jgi:hypothetical protein